MSDRPTDESEIPTADEPTDEGDVDRTATLDEETHETTLDPDPLNVTGFWKVRGKADAPDGTGVLGENTATSGTPVGVYGKVPNTSGWGLCTPGNAMIGNLLEVTNIWAANSDPTEPTIRARNEAASGAPKAIKAETPNTSSDYPVGVAMDNDEVAVGTVIVEERSTNGVTVHTKPGTFEISGNTDTGDALNNVQGHESNEATSGVVGAVIGGGGFDDGEFDASNKVFDDYGTIAGGDNNRAGSSSDTDPTSAEAATVGGGRSNHAGAAYSTVPGGFNNTASGDYSFAAGRAANTSGYAGAIVFGDSSSTPIQAQGADEARFQMDVYAPTVTETSARAEKTGIEPVESGAVLAGVESLEVCTWEFADDTDGTRHMGPMAGDFHETFGIGDDDGAIASVDRDGVALAAIQGLSERLDDARAELADARAELADARADLAAKDDRIAALEAETDRIDDLAATVEVKDDRIGDLEAENEDLMRETETLRAENERLRERVADLEDRLATLAARVEATAAPADD